MDAQIQRSSSSSGGGGHVCRKCGWPFPKPHPSARHRRAHKKVCGKIEGYSRVAYGDGVVSDDDSRGETLIEGSKSVEKSARRGGSEEEMFADAVAEFADGREPGNVGIADAGNLYPPSSANGAQQNLSSSSVDSVPGTGSDAKEGENSACETANEATLDRKSEEVAEEERFGSDGKINGSEKSFRATEDANEEPGRRLETFTSCNDRFYNMAETDYLLLRENSEVVLEGSEDQRTEIGETVDTSEALEDPKSAEEPSVEKKGEEAQQNLILTDASARNFLDDIDTLAKSMKGVGQAGEYVECGHKDARIYVASVAKEELTLTSENFSAADNEVRSGQAEAERKFEHEFPVVFMESKDAIHVENNVLGNNAISGTDDNVDSKESIAITKGRDLDQQKQEETVAAVGVQVDSDAAKRVDGDMDLVKENLSESAPIDHVEASLESKDTIAVENNVLKSLQESEAANNAISGTAGNVGSTQSLAITKERDMDQGKQEENVAVLGIQVDSNSETHSIEDVNLMKEEETVSRFENVKADSGRDGFVSGSSDGDRDLVKREEMATVSALDVQADASSQTDSMEGNQGSVSAATETEPQPPQAPAKVQPPTSPPGSGDDNQEISDPPSTASLVKPNEAQTPGSKKSEEIGAEKRHMPLKSFLGDSSPPRNTPAKEWNSPARYPTNIKREKGKGRSRAWAPFICCSSARTS